MEFLSNLKWIENVPAFNIGVGLSVGTDSAPCSIIVNGGGKRKAKSQFFLIFDVCRSLLESSERAWFVLWPLLASGRSETGSEAGGSPDAILADHEQDGMTNRRDE